MIKDVSVMDRPFKNEGPSRRVWVAGITLLLALIAAALILPSLIPWLNSETSIEASRVRIAEVTRGDLVREISVEGRIVAASHPTSFSPARGIVTLHVVAGEVVEAGDLLAVVASPELNNMMAQEVAALNSLDSNLERTRLEARTRQLAAEQTVELGRVELNATERMLERAEKLHRLGLSNEIDLEASKDDVVVAKLKLEQAEKQVELGAEMLRFQLEDSEKQLDRQRLVVDELKRKVEALHVRAGVAGQVAKLHVEDRQAVEPNDALVTIVDLSDYQVEIEVAETYSNEIGPGTEAIVNAGGTEHGATVLGISPEVESHRVKARLQFAGAVPAGLKQNQRITTRLILDTKANVVKVARGPFLEDAGGHVAYVIDGAHAYKRSITAGSTSISEVEITSGLNPGEKIIISDIKRFENADTILLR